jgi:hypothetical protein
MEEESENRRVGETEKEEGLFSLLRFSGSPIPRFGLTLLTTEY